jgi:Tol biopolymer transport system component
LYLANSDGSGQIERLTTSERMQIASSWSSGNNSIAYLERQAGNEIWVLPMDGDRKPRLFLAPGPGFDFFNPEFSPDGHWIAYVSTESGSFEVYVQPYPGPGEKHRISTEGGTQPIWTANGRELVFRRSAEEVYSASITSLNPFQAEAPRLLVSNKSTGYSSTTPVRGWDASADGQRFLFTKDEPSKDKPVTQIEVVLNWDRELKRRVPAK